ncbi:MAG: esterase family protein [Clostridia bacterium]|nr:esterase family protein [Clostridia bacterium]
MAVFKMSFASKELKQTTHVNIIIPGNAGDKIKTMWLLHGLSGDQDAWMDKTAIERYANSYRVAVIMPTSDRCWYTDTAYGKNYFTFLTEELPEVCRKYFRGLSDAREDNMITGLSMGGYGAVKAALTCPEKYGYCGGLSASLDITREGKPYDLNEWRSIFGFELNDARELAGTKHDIFALLKKNYEEKKELPDFYTWCGTEDGLLTVNKKFSAALDEYGYKHKFEYSEGNHSWKWWDLHIKDVFRYCLREE